MWPWSYRKPFKHPNPNFKWDTRPPPEERTFTLELPDGTPAFEISIGQTLDEVIQRLRETHNLPPPNCGMRVNWPAGKAPPRLWNYYPFPNMGELGALITTRAWTNIRDCWLSLMVGDERVLPVSFVPYAEE